MQGQVSKKRLVVVFPDKDLPSVATWEKSVGLPERPELRIWEVLVTFPPHQWLHRVCEDKLSSFGTYWRATLIAARLPACVAWPSLAWNIMS